MEHATRLVQMAYQADMRVSDVVEREQSRLMRFIRRRVPDTWDAEDILQDVFTELVEANRLLMPIDHITAWLFQVARNRITDLLRRKRPEHLADLAVGPEDNEDDEELQLDDWLPSPDAGPEAAYARKVLLAELRSAIEALPEEQREVLIAHELEGRKFKQLAADTGININTLLARKRYAVQRLRQRLRPIYDEFLAPRSVHEERRS